MVDIERKRRTHSLWLRVAGCLTTAALLCGPLPGFWSGSAWGQQAPMQLNPSVYLQKERRSKTNFAVQRLLVNPPAPNLTPIALPVTNPTSALGSALVSCDKEAEGYQPASLPGGLTRDRKSTRLNSSHQIISYAVFCL